MAASIGERAGEANVGERINEKPRRLAGLPFHSIGALAIVLTAALLLAALLAALAGLLLPALLLLTWLLLAATLLLPALLLLTGALIGVLVLIHSISFQRWSSKLPDPVGGNDLDRTLVPRRPNGTSGASRPFVKLATLF